MSQSFTALALAAAMLWASPALAQDTSLEAADERRRSTAPVMAAAASYASQLRLTAPVPRIARSLSGGQKILLGAGIGFAVPTAIMINAGHSVDEKLVVGVGMTGALMGAAIVYNLIR